MSERGEENFKNAEMCWVYEQPFLLESQHVSPDKNEIIAQKSKNCPRLGGIKDLRDHCHKTGKYRRTAHVFRIPISRQAISKNLPVTFHNLSTFDARLFLPE